MNNRNYFESEGRKQTVLSENENPFVLSQDINYLLRDWAAEKGYRIPDPRPYQRELAGEIKSMFPVSEIIGEKELQETAKETLVRSEKNEGICLSMDRAYMPAVDVSKKAFYLDSSRQIDKNFNSIGLGTRDKSNPDLLSQLISIQKKVGTKPVDIYDDVAFGGDTMLEVLSLAKKSGLNIKNVNLAISTTEAIEKITKAGFNCLVGYEYKTILDEICERDFFVGSPYSGRTIIDGAETKGAPYLLPLGLPVEWASVPEKSAIEFSQFCLTLALDFWTKSEKISGRNIPTNALAKPPLKLAQNQSVSRAIRNILQGGI